MIVPRARLLFWVAVIVLPFALLGAASPAAGGISVLSIAIFLLLAAIDALGAQAALAGFSVELPEVVRLAKDRAGKIECRIRNARGKAAQLRLAPALPRQIRSPRQELDVTLAAATEWSRIAWDCRPAKRGSFPLRAVYIEGGSPLGFWAARRALPTDAEIRVYPNLLTERRGLAALFLHRGAFGLHAQRQVGKGREFEKLREYVPGDGFDEVHWKATARRGRPITKVFQIERTQEVYVVVDASRLSARPAAKAPSRRVPVSIAEPASSELSDDTQETSTLERFITAALVLGLAAEQQGDLFGVLTFTNQVGAFVRAKNGRTHYNACRDALYALEPQVVTPDYDEVCAFIRVRLRRRALLFFLTALDDAVLAESFVRNMDLIRRQHLVVVNMLQPPGVAPAFTNPEVSTVDDLYRQLGGHMLWNQLRELERVLQRRAVRFSLLQDERLSAQLVSQYLDVKRRQLL